MGQPCSGQCGSGAGLCREKNLEKTIKEARLKAKKEANKKDEGGEAACDEDLHAIESEFYSATGAAHAAAPDAAAATGGG